MTSKTTPRSFRTHRRSVLRTLTPLLLLVICAMTAGCADRPMVIDNGCSWVKPIYVSPDDVLTDPTAKAIRSHDNTGARICGWKPKQ
jgi:hypothetical protein